MKRIKAREIICGKPSKLINRGKIREEALIRERFTINELEERLRGANIPNLGDVEYAILETSGQLTVIPKPNKRTTIPEDFNIEPEYEGIPYDLVIDGVIMRDNLKEIGKDEKWLNKEVRKIRHKSKPSTNSNSRRKRTNILPEKGEVRKMRKEAIIVVVILLAIIILNIITQKYTNTHMTELTNKLTDIKTEISNEDKDEEKIIQKMEDAFSYWDDVKEKFVIYLEHTELEKVEMYMKEAKSNIETKEWSMVVVSLDTAVFILDHMQEKYEFSLKNIF